jgi:hypothetical protein
MSEDAGLGADNAAADGVDGVDSGDDFAAPTASDWWKFDSKDRAEEWANNLVTKRLARERKKIDPILQEHATLKSEVEELRPLREATQTDSERWESRLQSVTQELEELRGFKASRERDDLVREIAEDKGLPTKFFSRVRGEDAGSISADIDDLLNVLSLEGGKSTKPAQRKPKEAEDDSSSKARGFSGGGGSDDNDEVTAEAIMKRLQESGRARGGRSPFSLR